MLRDGLILLYICALQVCYDDDDDDDDVFGHLQSFDTHSRLNHSDMRS